MDLFEFSGTLLTVTVSIFLFWLMIIVSVALCRHHEEPRKRLICINKNHASFLIEDSEWQEVMDNAQEIS